jgi:hypothetical protein
MPATLSCAEDDAVGLFGAISRLVKKYENRELTLFIDEMENPKPLVGDSLVMFCEAIGGLVDL